MPEVLTFVAIAIADALYAAGVIASVGAIETFIVGTLISTALSATSSILLKPKTSNLSQEGSTLTFRAPTEAARIVYGQTRVGGPILFLGTSQHTASNDNKYLHLVIALAGHEVDAIGDVYFNDEVIAIDGDGNPTGTLRNFAIIRKWLGAADQTADSQLKAAFSTITDAHRFRGIACLYVRLLYDTTKYAQGVPNISAIVRGRKVYDPRDAAQDADDPTTWVWSDNAALCMCDYLRGAPGLNASGALVREYGVQSADSEIDFGHLETEASVCDELVDIAGGGTEKRYTINGSIDTDVAPGEALTGLMTAMGGRLAWAGGMWRILAGYYRTPVVTLTDDDLAGPVRTQAKRARRDLFNGVKGVFVSASNKYQPADFPAVQVPAYVAQDNGEEIWADMQFAFTNTASACQRLASMELARNRQQIVTERRFKLSALKTQVGDVTLLDDSRKGWTAKPFEIQRWGLTVDSDANGTPALFIDMTLVETASSIYDWDATTELGIDTAPDTNLPDPRVVAAPGAPGIVEELYSTRDGGGVKTKVTVSWSPSTDGFLRDYQLEHKLHSASIWTVSPRNASTVSILLDFNAGAYDFRVKAYNQIGAESGYSTSENLTVNGLGAVPAALTGVNIQALGNQAAINWAQSVDLDVREGGQIEFRHSPATSGATWATSTTIRDAVPGAATSAFVPLKAGSYVLRAVDSTGNASAIATITTKQASQHGFSSLASSPYTESTTFTGTKTGCAVSSGTLVLSGAGLFDDIPDFDAMTDLDSFGGIGTTGTYDWSTVINFGAITKARLTTAIDVVINNALDQIDDRTDNIDDWADFDGASAGDADAWVEFRQTDTNPSGSPTWGAWNRLDVSEVDAWGVQLRAQLRAYDPAYNIAISTLSVKAEAVT